MPAPIVTQGRRKPLPRYYARGCSQPQKFIRDYLLALRATQGQLWERVAEGKTR